MRNLPTILSLKYDNLPNSYVVSAIIYTFYAVRIINVATLSSCYRSACRPRNLRKPFSKPHKGNDGRIREGFNVFQAKTGITTCSLSNAYE